MTIKPTVLVTAATGKTGAAACRALMNENVKVRALVHRFDHRSKSLQDMGIEILCGNLADYQTMQSAMKGVHRVYYCSPPELHMMSKFALFLALAQEQKIESIVLMGQWLSDPLHPTLATRDTYFAEKMLDLVSEISTSVINPGWFADNYFLVMEPMAQLGIMPMPLGGGLNAPPSNEDLGRVIAKMLVTPSLFENKVIRPTGPELLNPVQIASIVGNALKRKVRYQDIPESLFLKAIRSQGWGDFFPTMLKYYTQDYRENAFAVNGVTNVVEEVTGRKAENFEQIARRYVENDMTAQKGLGRKLTAIKNFARILITSKPNVANIENEWQIKHFAGTTTSSHSPVWTESHSKPNAYNY